MAIKRPTFEDIDEWFPDYETSNSSAIALASVLRKKGIENHSFFLKLYDEDLIGVDPHDENLSMEMKVKVITECHKNFFYFAREIMRIPGPGGGINFAFNRGNLAAMWCFLNGVNTFLVMPRQFGKTWIALTYALWVFNFGSTGTKMLFMNKALKDSQENLKRLKDARDLLPDYLQLKMGEAENGKMTTFLDNMSELRNVHKNEIITKASARNVQQAENLGRGLSIPFLWFDELAFLAFNDTIWAAAIPAWKKAATVAKDNGAQTALLITTTPGDLSVPHGMFAWTIKDKAARFTEELYSYDEDEVDEWFGKNSENNFMYIEFAYTQLGLKDPETYYREMEKDLLFNYPKIRREILLQWSQSTSNSPFNPDDIEDLRNMMIKQDDNSTIKINKFYKLNVYRELNPRDKYIISVDPGKGRGGKADSTAIVVVNARTGNIHAIFKSNIIKYKETFRFVYTLVLKHIPNSVIVVENNIDTLVEYFKESPLKHLLYYEFKTDNTTDKRKNGVLQRKDKNTLIYGITTTSGNRPKYFDILFDYVSNKKDAICCEEMLEEVEKLEYKTPTRIEAISGAHDDVVLAYLISQYVMIYGNNKARFGLYFSDTVDTDASIENRNRESAMFKRIFRNNDSEESRRGMALYDNPFFNGLLVKPETLEDIEKKLARSLSIVHEDDDFEDNYRINVFTGEKDQFGIETMDANAFAAMNSNSWNPDEENIFGDSTPNPNPFGLMNDDTTDSWWT